MSRLPAQARSRADPYSTSASKLVVHMAACAGVRSLHRLVATHFLCRDTGHGCDTGSKRLCCDRENHYRDSSHPVLALTLSRHQSSILTWCQAISIAIEELWVVFHDRDFLSRQVLSLVMLERTRSCAEFRSRARTLACHVRCCEHCVPVACIVMRTGAHLCSLCLDTGDPVSTQG